MKWTRSMTIALASAQCPLCEGVGMMKRVECRCVRRAIFRICARRYRRCLEEQIAPGTPCRRVPMWSRLAEEYVADFELLAKRVLEPVEHRIFKMHLLGGADWRYCTRVMKLDRGMFSYHTYRAMEKIGRACAEHKVFPPAEYFGAQRELPEQPIARRNNTKILMMADPKDAGPVKVPGTWDQARRAA